MSVVVQTAVEAFEGVLSVFGNKIALGKFVQIELVAIAGFKFAKQPFSFGLRPETMIEIGLRSAFHRCFVGQTHKHVVQHVMLSARIQHLVHERFEFIRKCVDQFCFLRE